MKMKNNDIKNLRTWFLFSICFLLLLFSFYFAVQNRSQNGGVNQHSETILDAGFDTFVTYTENTDQASFDKHLNLIKERFSYYNSLFDYYNTYDSINNLKSINDAAGKHAVIVDEALIECLLYAKQFTDYNSHFDATQGNLLNVWHEYREKGIELNEKGESGNVPPLSQLQDAFNENSWNAVEINSDERSVYINDPSVSIDLGGIAKGFAVQKIEEELVEAGVRNAILNAGGNVMLIGNKEKEEPWRVGIQVPGTDEKETGNIAVLSLNGSHAVVTSGDYQRYYEANGKRYSHIIDPLTLYPAEQMRSVTVICDDSTAADAISTTLFTMSYEEGAAYLKELEERGIYAQVVWVFDESSPSIPDTAHKIKKDPYTIVYSSGLEQKIE